MRAQFKERSCRVYANDLRVKITGTKRYCYPDVAALCDPALFDDEHKDTLINPTLIVEVLSASTEACDRGEKFEYYRCIESLTEYVLVDQAKLHVEQFARQANDQWIFSSTSGLHSLVELVSVSCRLSLAEVYDKVQFGQEPAEA